MEKLSAIATKRGPYHKLSDNWVSDGKTKCGILLHYLYIEKLSNVLDPYWRYTRKRKVTVCKKCFREYLSSINPYTGTLRDNGFTLYLNKYIC